MANFEDAHRFVAAAEGGFQADPRDAGNWTGGRVNRGRLVGTHYGIAAPTLRAWRGRDVSRADMEALTEAEAEQIYRARYWAPYGFDALDPQLATLLYDGTVNQGPGLLRRALLYTFGHLNLTVYQRATTAELVARAATLDPAAVHELVWQYRRDQYPAASPFYRGWLRRLDQLRRA